MTPNNTNSLPPQLLLIKTNRLNDFQLKYSEIYSSLNDSQKHLLGHFFALSDFGFEQLMRHGDWITQIYNEKYLTKPQLEPIIKEKFEQLKRDINSEVDLEKSLRIFRNYFQSIIAWRDLCRLVDIEQSLLDVSILAETLIIGARDCLTEILVKEWGHPYDENGNRQPLMILGMGKLGGCELNFSSDIDLIFSFPRHGKTAGGRRSTDNQEYFIKLGKKLVNALDKITVDGFVYRVDMRLRPFGSSGPLVVSFAALEDYYQFQGRDWERYAMVKSRVLGEDTDYAQELKLMIRPFMFRRYIDFSAIESLRKMKLMISHEVRRRGLIDNIKLGSGGIREVEFIVQVFQMIRGGREPQLQHQSILITLEALAALSIFNADEYEALKTSYLFLRLCEQTLQQINDKQTQTLPDNELDWQRLLVVTNQTEESDFRRQLKECCDVVIEQFNQVVGQEDEPKPAECEIQQSLVMVCNTDIDSDGETILDELGCLESKSFFKEILDLNTDLTKRQMGVRGQETMGKLMPLIVQQLLAVNDGHLLFKKIANILKTIATRTAYIELLLENPGALKQLISLCQASDWIGKQLTHHPILLDELLDPKSLYSPTPLNEYSAQLRQYLMRIPEDDMEQLMEGLRQYKQYQQLRIAAADVTDMMDVITVSDHLTALAQAIVEYVQKLAWQQLAERFGTPEFTGDGIGFAVIGYGKVGGWELGYGSDLDLVFVHSALPNTTTNGNKIIDSAHFYLKLSQRILHLFNTRTVSGILYELDMRLRPSGNKGLMVTHIDSFIDYQQQEAWVWEHQALVRTRVICGSHVIDEKFKMMREHILCKQRDIELLRNDVAKMRVKMRDHLTQGNEEFFDLKQDNGGIADIEFIAQFLVLGYSHQFIELTIDNDNASIFEQAANVNLIDEHQKNILIQAYQAYRHKGHRLVLNDLKNYTSEKEFDEHRNQIRKIWRQLLLTPSI